MKFTGERLIQVSCGGKKKVQLLQTSCERCVVGEQGYLIGSLSSKWIVCIPPGALDHEQAITVFFYQVIESVGLDSTEFITGILQITSNRLQLSKPIEVLMRHHLCIEDEISEVNVLSQSGEAIDKAFTSVCQLSSVDESVCSSDMKISLCDEFVHIETPYPCRFSMDCKGKKFFDVWASLFGPECPDKEHFYIQLSLNSKAPVTDDDEARVMKRSGLVPWCHHRVILRCDKQENLQIAVQILPSEKGWRILSGSHVTIAYNQIKDMVIYGIPVGTSDFLFSKGKSHINVTDVAPVFKFNGFQRVLCGPLKSPEQPANSALMANEGKLIVYGGNVTERDDIMQPDPPDHDPGLTVAISSPEVDTFQRLDEGHRADSDSDIEVAPKQPRLTNECGIDRPIKESDITYIAGCDYISQHWMEIGWLMLKSRFQKLSDIRKNVVELVPHTSDRGKVKLLIEQWQQSKKTEATARALVDICCHPVVGGVRHIIKDALFKESNSDSGKQCINNWIT
jgi:hypothetical protein